MASAPRSTSRRGAQRGALAGAAAAACEADQFDGFGDVLESAFVGGEQAEVRGAGAVVLGLHAADDAEFHGVRLAFVGNDGFIIARKGTVVSRGVGEWSDAALPAARRRCGGRGRRCLPLRGKGAALWGARPDFGSRVVFGKRSPARLSGPSGRAGNGGTGERGGDAGRCPDPPGAARTRSRDQSLENPFLGWRGVIWPGPRSRGSGRRAFRGR